MYVCVCVCVCVYVCVYGSHLPTAARPPRRCLLERWVVMGCSPSELSEELCDVGEAKEGLENEL